MFTPSSTYRWQFSKDFTFREAFSLIGYLGDLGISTVYASPILQAYPGSNHGYDVTNFRAINPELGTIKDLQVLLEGLQEKGISWLQDIVPNHMSFSAHNKMLWDVLKKGTASEYAVFFDIDWEHPLFGGRLCVPLLDKPLHELIQADQFSLSFSDEGFSISYGPRSFPLNKESAQFLLTGYFPFDPGLEKDQAILRLAALSHDRELIQTLLSEQHYLLCPYYSTDKEINFRRFFAINSLIALRMEDERVFDAYHRFTKELYDKGWIQGLRIDHIDGLKDPKVYVDRLRALFGKECYIIAEKILDIKEDLPSRFDLQGTSGYEFLSSINQALTDGKGSQEIVQFYNELAPGLSSYADVVFQNKHRFLIQHLNGEWNNLVRGLLDSGLPGRPAPDQARLKEALGLFMACFPIYRVYISRNAPFPFAPLEKESLQWIIQAFEAAEARGPGLEKEWTLLKSLFEPAGDGKDALRAGFLQRFMQLNGPLAAKGVEDTTFYCYNALVSHNEVGGSPVVLGTNLSRFHDKMRARQEKGPLSLNCTSTHDTKRGEDTRTRINLITERSQEWISLVKVWQVLNRPLQTKVKGKAAPTRNDEYFLYQSILGAFPETGRPEGTFSERTKNYLQKALRESGMSSSHTHPDLDYEKACLDFIDRLLDPVHPFTRTLLPFLQQVIAHSHVYSLATVVIKATAPGIPDFYQGTELWDLSYVDPDNRRPVDFARRQKMMKEMKEAQMAGPGALTGWLSATEREGGLKMYTIRTILHLRKQYADLFRYGQYIPLPVPGADRQILAYARAWKGKWIMVVVPVGIGAEKKQASSQGTQGDYGLTLPEGFPAAWLNIFTGESPVIEKETPTKNLFIHFPVAVLESVSSTSSSIHPV